MARRYGQRPSSLIGIRTTRLALDFDLAVMARARQAQQDHLNGFMGQEGGFLSAVLYLLKG